jgi:hypothetical protein
MSAWEVWDPWQAAILGGHPCGHSYREGIAKATEPCGEYVQAPPEEAAERRREIAEQAQSLAAAMREDLEQRAKEATRRAVARLAGSDSESEPLATIRRINTPRGPGGGAVNWLALKERVGRGWYIGQLDWTCQNDGARVSTRMVLAEDGRLLEGDRGLGPRVRPGRYLSFLRSEVIAIVGLEFDMTRCTNASLEDLATGLLEIASGETHLFPWGQSA